MYRTKFQYENGYQIRTIDCSLTASSGFFCFLFVAIIHNLINYAKMCYKIEKQCFFIFFLYNIITLYRVADAEDKITYNR